MFRYDADVVARFPTIRGGALHAGGIDNGPSSPELQEAFVAEQRAVAARLGDTPLAAVPSLAAWRRAFSAFGVAPTKYRSAAEALLRRLTKKGDVPSINALVDIGNLVSVRYALPVAVFDLGAVAGGLTVRFATGAEPWEDLGGSETAHPEPGEVVFCDEAGAVHARRWCWRQSAASAAGPGTSDVLVTVEGHHDAAGDDVAAAVVDLRSLLAAHASADVAGSAVLSPERTVFPV